MAGEHLRMNARAYWSRLARRKWLLYVAALAALLATAFWSLDGGQGAHRAWTEPRSSELYGVDHRVVSYIELTSDLLRPYVSYNKKSKQSSPGGISAVAPEVDMQGLLKVAGASQLRDALQLYQHDVCQVLAAQGATPGSEVQQAILGDNVAAAKMDGVTYHVYSKGDIVSDHIAKGQAWEAQEIAEAKWALKALPPPEAARSRRPETLASLGLLRRRNLAIAPIMIDIGANIGWFTLQGAKAGARVLAFEGMPSNQGLIRASLCANPEFSDRVTLYPVGLGAKNDTCWLVAGDGNVGDGFTTCGVSSATEAESKHQKGYYARGMMVVRRLDDILADWPHDVQVLKMDVEGYEGPILEGAQRFMATHNVWYIMLEANEGIVGQEGVTKLLRKLHDFGYKLSDQGFQGPWISEGSIVAGDFKLASVNVYGVRVRNIV